MVNEQVKTGFKPIMSTFCRVRRFAVREPGRMHEGATKGGFNYG